MQVKWIVRVPSRSGAVLYLNIFRFKIVFDSWFLWDPLFPSRVLSQAGPLRLFPREWGSQLWFCLEVNEFFADIMPRLLQYKSDRETLQYLCSTHCYMLIRKRACGLGSVVRVSRVSGAFSHRRGCGWAEIQLNSKYFQNEVHILSTAN